MANLTQVFIKDTDRFTPKPAVAIMYEYISQVEHSKKKEIT